MTPTPGRVERLARRAWVATGWKVFGRVAGRRIRLRRLEAELDRVRDAGLRLAAECAVMDVERATVRAVVLALRDSAIRDGASDDVAADIASLELLTRKWTPPDRPLP